MLLLPIASMNLKPATEIAPVANNDKMGLLQLL